MTMNSAPADRRLTNPVYWLMWLLPGSAVVAGLSTLFIALRSADRPLPESYHWEGARLDEDFAQARAAAALGVEVEFGIRDGRCRAIVHGVPHHPAALNVLLANGADASLDRRVRLMRVAADEYHAACAPLAAGKWRVAFADDSGSWSVRAVVGGNLAAISLRARKPEGGL
jgi:hypothetical protein